MAKAKRESKAQAKHPDTCGKPLAVNARFEDFYKITVTSKEDLKKKDFERE